MVTHNGQKKAGGTSKAGANKPIPDLHKALILAAEAAGEDGRGRGGLVSYLRRWALTDPKSFVPWLERFLPYVPPGLAELENPADITKLSDEDLFALKRILEERLAQDAAEQKKQGYRRCIRGAPKRAIPPLPEALVLAAESVGEDGRGRNGLIGYLKRWAVTDLGSFARMLGPILPELERAPGPS
jgi:hypothetical protein